MRLPDGVVALCTVQFVDVLGVTVVVTALPTMLADLGGSPSSSSLVVTGYAMFFGGLLVLGARCGDRFGHRLVLQAGIVLFGLASLVAAVTPSVVVLVVARCLQGAAAAMSVPAALRLLTAIASTPAGAPDGAAASGGVSGAAASRGASGRASGRASGAGASGGGSGVGASGGGSGVGVAGRASGGASAEEVRRRALALWSASGAAAGASGFVLGGLVPWRAVFWGTLVLAAVLVLAVRRAVPPGRGDPAQRLDVAGATVLTASVMALVVGAALISPAGAVLVAAGLVLVPVLVAVERRQRVPLLPGAAVRSRTLRAGTLGSFLNTATTSSTATLVTLHLQGVDRLSPVAAGLLLLPFSLAVVVGAPLAARALRRWSPRRVIALGLGLIAVANLGLLPFTGAAAAVPFCMVLGGLGIGLSSVAATATGTDVPEDLQGVASGVLNTAAQLGTALGVAAILLVATLSATSGAPADGAEAGWLAAALLAAAGTAYFTLSRPHLPDPSRRTAPKPR